MASIIQTTDNTSFWDELECAENSTIRSSTKSTPLADKISYHNAELAGLAHWEVEEIITD